MSDKIKHSNVFQNSTKIKLIAVSSVIVLILLVSIMFYKLSFLLQINNEATVCNDQVCMSRILDGAPNANNVYVKKYLRTNYFQSPRGGQYNLSKAVDGVDDDRSYVRMKEIVKEAFKHKKNGIFLVLGAGDGEHKDLTLDLEQNNGWTGLLVEPLPYLFNKLKSKNRNAEIANLCVSPYNFPWKAYMNHPTIGNKYQTEEDQLKLYRQGNLHILDKKQEGTFNKSVVQCVPLPTIIANSQVIDREVDLLVLDMGGEDGVILANVAARDFPKVNTAVVMYHPDDENKYASTILNDIDLVEARSGPALNDGLWQRAMFVRVAERTADF